MKRAVHPIRHEVAADEEERALDTQRQSEQWHTTPLDEAGIHSSPDHQRERKDNDRDSDRAQSPGHDRGQDRVAEISRVAATQPSETTLARSRQLQEPEDDAQPNKGQNKDGQGWERWHGLSIASK